MTSLSAPRTISRNSLAWLFAVQVLVLAPHFFYLPLWLAVVWLLVAFWRWRIFQGAWNYPNKVQKSLAVAACCVGLLLTFGSGVRFELLISLLLIGFSLKLLELKNRTDFVLLIFIAFFIVATQFIEFNQFAAAFYGFFCVALLCTALMQLYKNTVSSLVREVLPSFYILMQAIPFMLLLFIVVPRLGSFWAVPSPQQAKTGMSDAMAPGSFTELMESDELAFRVTFTGKIPSHDKLYWRGLVFSFFDGNRWTQAREQQIENRVNQTSKRLRSHIDYIGDKTEYDVIAEPSGQMWLYALAAPISWSDNIGFASDLRVQAFAPVTERMSYKVISSLNYNLHLRSDNELTANLQLPKSGNLKTREQAKQWMQDTGTPEKLIEKLLSYYHQKFTYTLNPPALGANNVDDFLWRTQQGFCEHFSSSFVFFLRAAGVPARVVVGYQGGDINSIDNYLVVHQRDAHAWAEVWLEGRGWVMFDPTAAVAPERVRKGIAESLSAADQKMLAKPFGASLKLLLLAREQWDALNYQWTRWVMNYDSSLQSSLLENIMGEVSAARMALFVLASGGLALLLLLAFLMLRTRKRDISDAVFVYRQLCKKLATLGFTPLPSETPRAFLLRVTAARTDLSAPLVRFAQLFEVMVYGEQSHIRDQLLKELAAFNPRKVAF